MKKILSLVLVLTLVLGSMSLAFATPSDVVGTDYEDAVNRLVAVGIINGYEDGTFRPDQTITRAEFAKIVVTALGLGDAAQYGASSSSFTDVAGHWAAGYINIAASEGIVNGMGDGTFAPDATVTFEQSVTMLVRALGYEPAVTGGYPSGYLVKAAELDITEDVDGVVGQPAPRGIVALLTDNALETPLMIQVGYGDEAKFVISGEDDTAEQTILETKLDMSNVDEMVVNIPRTDSDLEDNEIELADTGVVEVLDGFDFEGVFGTEITAYINDDDVVVAYEVNDDVILDSATWDSSDEELDLYNEDESYEINEDAVVYVDGEEAEVADAQSDFDYVKVILNDDDEIIFIDAFNLEESMIIEEVDEELVLGTDEDASDIELDLEDYTIVKAGQEIAIADLAEGDILYFNDDAEYAEVYATEVTGELNEDEIFTNDFELDGEEYTVAGTYVDEDGEMAEVDVTALEDMAEADDNTVKLTLNRAGEVRFVEGNIEEAEAEETGAAYLTDDMVVYSSRNELYVAIDAVNENGAEVAYDVALEDVDLYDNGTLDTTDYEDGDVIAGEESLVELTIDEDGDVTEVAFNLDNAEITEDIDVEDDNYAGNYRLSDDVVVFDLEEYLESDDVEDMVATTWENIEGYDLVKTGDVYYDEDGYVTYVVIEETDSEEDNTDMDILVSEVRVLSNGEEWRIDGFVDGEEVTLYTDSDEFTTAPTIAAAVYGDLLTVAVDDNTNKIVEDGTKAEAIEDVIKSINYSDNEVTFEGADDSIDTDDVTYELVSDGNVYDATDSDDVEVAKLRDLDEGDTVKIYLDVTGTKFAKAIVLTTEAE